MLDVSDCLLVVKERQVVGKQARYDRTHSLLQTDVVVVTWQVYLSVHTKSSNSQVDRQSVSFYVPYCMCLIQINE